MSALSCGCDPDLTTRGRATPYVSPECQEHAVAWGQFFTLDRQGWSVTLDELQRIGNRPTLVCWCEFADERVCPVHGKESA